MAGDARWLGPGTARQLLPRANRAEVTTMPVPIDVDTREDYERLPAGDRRVR